MMVKVSFQWTRHLPRFSIPLGISSSSLGIFAERAFLAISPRSYFPRRFRLRFALQPSCPRPSLTASEPHPSSPLPRCAVVAVPVLGHSCLPRSPSAPAAAAVPPQRVAAAPCAATMAVAVIPHAHPYLHRSPASTEDPTGFTLSSSSRWCRPRRRRPATAGWPCCLGPPPPVERERKGVRIELGDKKKDPNERFHMSGVRRV
jgi:hypothetical protein